MIANIFKHVKKLSRIFEKVKITKQSSALPSLKSTTNMSTSTSKQELMSVAHSKKYIGVFVDLDNLIGQISSRNASPHLLDQLIIEMAEPLKGEVKAIVYGNLCFHGLTVSTFKYKKLTVEYRDTPVVGYEGKTSTDTIMVVDMLELRSQLAKAILVSCDVDFTPVAKSFKKHQVCFELVKFGPTRKLLLDEAQTVHDGYQFLDKVTKLTAEQLLITALASNRQSLPLAKASQVLARWQYNTWQENKNFVNFLKKLSIPNLQIDTNIPGRVYIKQPQVSVGEKLKNMGVPVLNKRQYALLFKAIANSQLGRSPKEIIDKVHSYCLNNGCNLTHDEIKSVVVKVLPEMNTSSKPQRFASKYLSWMFQKSKVCFGGVLNAQDKVYIKSIIHA